MGNAMKLPQLNNIKIEDKLWNEYVNMVSDVIVPYQWDILNDRVEGAEESHCIDNFKIMTGEIEEERKGVVFIDTDIYKWLESVSYCIQNGTGKKYIELADEVVDIICRAQLEDGYLNTYYTLTEPEKRWSNLVEGHELYSAGYLIEAAIAYKDATGNEKLLSAACKFADLICDVFGTEEGKINGYPGHQEIELALVKLYRVTGDEKYLNCAKYFIDERGKSPSYFEKEIEARNYEVIFDEFKNYDLSYSQAHMPAIEQKTAEGHAVRATYMYCAMADLANEYDDKKMLEACRTLWNSITQKRMYITGGIGSSGLLERFTVDYHLPNSSGYCETCASIGLALFGRRMFAIEKDSKYYDIVEKALYNTVLSGISEDGKRYFYVNPLEVWPEACKDHTSLAHVKPERQKWFDVACCPTNIARTLSSLGAYIYSSEDDTVYINLFISSSYYAELEKGIVNIEMKSSILDDGKVLITAEAIEGKQSKIAIRIPEYSDNPVFTLNGETVSPEIIKGYVYFTVGKDQKLSLEVDFNVKPRWITSDLNVRENAGKAALMKGPLVYCLEETDNGENLSKVYVDLNSEIIQVDELTGGLPVLSYKGYKLIAKEEEKLYKHANIELESVLLKAVPYCSWGYRGYGEMMVWQKIKL